MLNGTSRASTLIFHGPFVDAERANALRARGAQLWEVPRHDTGLELEAVLRELARRDVVRLLVEGGPRIHGALLDQGFVDYASVFVAPRILGDAEGMPLARGHAREHMTEALRIRAPHVRSFGDDVLIEGPLGPDSAEHSTP
jgi:diaminohydroxyphosphoribosylaminopyrimidine deaminase/5-amino-6-(5-phosphoribosylamino)uracil reductase